MSDSVDVICLALEQYLEGQKLDTFKRSNSSRVAMRRNALNYDSSGCVYIMSHPDERLHLITA
jgi:hypothetical protein